MSHSLADLILFPRSPLVFRSGRPFGSTGGGDAFGFPSPGTVAGALRAEFADQFDLPLDTVDQHADLRARVEVQGPLLARAGGGAIEIYLPRPADAVYLRTAGGAERLARAQPAALDTSCQGCDLPDGLVPVFVEGEQEAKRAGGPEFWSVKGMTAWLLGGSGPPAACATSLPPTAARTHVTIDPQSLTGAEGLLFQSAGLDFAARRVSAANQTLQPQRWGLLARVGSPAGADPSRLDQCVRRLGADGRTVRIVVREGAWPAVPALLADELAKLRVGDRVRLVLATPALLANGWLPGWLREVKDPDGKTKEWIGSPPGLAGIELRLIAAAIERWTPYSGWDMKSRAKVSDPEGPVRTGAPRAIRRLAPAGSVYWFELVSEAAADLAKLWLASISDDLQDRRDGFGLALPGLG